MAINQQDNARVTMFETPYMYNMLTGEQFPLLADGPFTWNDEHTEITFRIKPAAHWSDGTQVAAEDVAYTWATNVYYGTAAGVGYQDYIDTIDEVNSQTVVVKAKLDGNGNAINPLMVAAYLSSNYVIQKAWTIKLEERAGSDIQNDPADDVVYSGPYHKFFADDTQVVLMRDDNYWGQDASMWGKLPAPKYLAHVIYPDNDTGLDALKAGNVDISQQFVDNVQDLWLVDNLPISTYLPEAPYGIGASLPTAYYNLQSPGLDQVAIRKAIAIAVDYDAIIADAMTNQSATFDQVPRSIMNPTPAEQALYDQAAVEDLQWAGNDIAGANALLDAARIIDTNDDGWREYNGQNLHYVATCPNGWSDWQAAIELVAAAGQEIGIEITTSYPDWSDYQNVVTNWPLPSTGYDIFMMWSDGAGPTQPWSRVRHLLSSEFAETTGNWNGNWGGYSNPDADALIQAIPGETDPATLKGYYTDLTEIYLTDVPSFTLMYRPQSFHTVNESVWTGFPKSGDGTNPPVPPLNLTDGYSIAGLYNLTASPNPPITISFWEQEGADVDPLFDQLISEFQAANPGITIVRTHYENEDLKNQFLATSQAGTAPDVVRVPNDFAGPFVQANTLAPVSDLFEESFLNQFFQGALDPAVVRGTLWGVPDNHGNHLMLMYNKSLIADPPDTFEELITMANDLTTGEIQGFAYNEKEPYWGAGFYGAFGGWPLDANDQPQFNNQAFIDYLTYVAQLKADGVIPQDCDYGCADTLFKDGKAAMIINGDWALGDYVNALGDNLGVAPVPPINGHTFTEMTSGKYFMTSTGAAEDPATKEAVQKFITFMTSADVQKLWLDEMERLPSNKVIAQDPSITTDPVLAGSMSALANGRGMPAAPEMSCAWGAWRPVLEDVMDGTMTPETAAAAAQKFADDCVAAMSSGPGPTNIVAYPQDDRVQALNWPMGSTITLTINGTDYTDSQYVNNVAPWDPFTSFAEFFFSGSHDLVTRDTVTITGDSGSNTYTVVDLEITSVDPDTDTVYGVAPDNAYVEVLCDVPCNIRRHVQANDTGHWSANLSVLPDEPNKGNNWPTTYDIRGGEWFGAQQWNEQSNGVSVSFYLPNPRFEARANIDQVEAYEWAMGDELTLTINGDTDHSLTQMVDEAPWDPNQSYAVFRTAEGDTPHDLQPGDIVTLSNGTIIKETIVTNLEFTAIDVDADTVTGQAGSDSRVNIWACDSTHCSNRHVNSENSSSWTVDFRALGDEGNEQDTVDIINGTWIDSQQFDNDSDATMYGLNVVYPFITVAPSGHWIDGWNWPLGTQVTLTIGDYTSTAESIVTPWDPNSTAVFFTLPGDLDLMPGDVVTMSGDNKTKDLIVTNFAVTDMNEETNTLSGTASPNGPVIACADNAPGGCRFATADENGLWSMPADPNGFVVAPGVVGWAAETDSDGDETRMDWWVNQFTTHVSSIDRLDGNPTTASSVRFGVTFSKPVTGVDASDFSLTSNGVYWAAITGVTGSDAEYTVTVRTGFGNGTLRLNLIDNGSITDMNGGHLVGLYSYNGNFTNGQLYAILRPDGTLPRAGTLYFNGQQWGSVACWNPYSGNCNNAMAIAQQDNARVTVFETPYVFNMLDGKVYPLLANGPWSWNADRTELTFSLNPAAHWSDGTPVTAEDVAYTFAANVRIGTGADGYIDTIEAVDAHTVRVKAKLDESGKAINPLMVTGYLSTNYVIQKAWTQALEERTGGDMDAFFNDPANDFVSSGPYTLFFTDDTKVVLMRDDHYWGKNGSMWGVLPAPEYLAHVIYGDNDSANAAFKTGLVDVSQQFIENVQNLWLVDHLPVSTYLPDAPYQIGASLPTAFYNLNSNGLDQVAVRKAIAIAVNYDMIVANAMTNQSATFEQVPRSLMNPSAAEQALYDSSDPTIKALQWAGNDIEGAKALLDEAGIVDTDGNGIREYNGQDLHYVATCPNGWSDWQAAVEVLASVGAEIGIDITTNFPEWDVYQNDVTNWPLPATGYDIFMMWSDGAGPTQPWGRIYHLLSSDFAGTSGNWSGNWGGYSNPEADALINAIPGETDPANIKAAYTELTSIYLTDVPSFTVMYRPQSFHTVNESIWTGFPKANDGTNPIVPPLDLTDGYSIAGLYNLQITPAAFNKVAPANGVTGQPATVTLSWGTSPNAKSYEYCYSTSNKNCNSWVSAGTATSVTLNSLAPNTSYYWQVRAINHYGTTYADGKKQVLWSFKTGTVPASFKKTAPVNGVTGQPANPTLSWAPSAGAIAYLYCYDTSNDGNCTTWFDNGTATSVTLSGLAKNTTFYWQVKAVNSFGTTYANGAKAAFWSFKTGTLPASFYKTAPVNGATGQPVTPTLSWGVSNGATVYCYCYDNTNDNACTNWVNNGTTTRVTLSGMANRTTYYWQVKAVNSFGTTFANGSGTAFWSFKTK